MMGTGGSGLRNERDEGDKRKYVELSANSVPRAMHRYACAKNRREIGHY